MSSRVHHEVELSYQIRMHEIEAQNLELSIKNEELLKENAVLARENSQLKRMPLFIAAVIDVFDTGEVYLRQQGNNQEYLTIIPDTLLGSIQAGTKVAVNNSLSIVKVIPTTYDTRVRVMELDEYPDVTFEHIGGLVHEIEEVREAVEYPLTRPEIFVRVGVEPPKGILLFGPPGTGKTLIAKAVAHNAKATFIRMSGSELVHKFIGEGSQLVRDLFELARDKAPSIVFIDEIDAIGMTRTNDGTSGSAEVQRTMMQLLAEMDGFDSRGEVRIMAATNRVDMLDAALLRPGRFDRVVEIPLPDRDARREIFRIHTRKMNLKSPIDFDLLLEKTENMTGAELSAICMEAGMIAVRKDAFFVEQEDFIRAITHLYEEISVDERMYL
ncbi:MAG: proteasome-activating nucleotidase [Methanospirillaceae archaeon]|nr:proteasome-activating nucleotidase [Methanospirillaceae archaeon]